MCDDTNGVGDSQIPGQSANTDTGPATVRHNWKESDHPSVVVVEAVAAATDRSTTDLPPLQNTIDTDALDILLTGATSSVTVSFRYADTAVSVLGNGSIEIHVDGTPREENDE